MANILKRASFLIKNILFMFFFYFFGHVFPTFCLQFIAKRPFANKQNTAREIITDGIY